MSALALVLVHGCSSRPGERDRPARSRATEATSFEELRHRLADPDRNVRAVALSSLSVSDGPEASELAAAALEDKDGLVRATAARSLGELRDVSRAGILLLHLREDEDREVRQRCAEALGSLGVPEALSGLVAAVSDPESTVRLAVVRALSRSFSTQATESLSAALMGDTDWEIRVEAAIGLNRSRTPEALAPLERGLSDPNEFVRAEAAKGLRELRAAEIVAPAAEATSPPGPDSRSPE